MKRIALLICVVLLVGPGLWAQTAAPSTATDQTSAGTDTGSSKDTGGGTAGSGTAAGGSGEDEFFGSGEVEAKQGAAEKKNAAEAVEAQRLGLSGQLQALSAYTMTRDFVQGAKGVSDNMFGNTIMGDFLVDARLTKGFRMFMDLNLNYLPTGVPVPVNFTTPTGTAFPLIQTLNTLLDIKEVFVDFNFAQYRLLPRRQAGSPVGHGVLLEPY